MRLTTESGCVIARNVEFARSPLRRLIGLIGRKEMPAGSGLMIEGCAWVHTLFMRFPIDALFVDGGLRIIRIDSDLRPWRLGHRCPGASSVIELPVGTADMCGLEEGDRLRLISE